MWYAHFVHVANMTLAVLYYCLGSTTDSCYTVPESVDFVVAPDDDVLLRGGRGGRIDVHQATKNNGRLNSLRR